MAPSGIAAAAVLLAALGLHLALRRAARAAARVLAGRAARRGGEAFADTLRWRRRVGAALLPVQAALWTGAAALVVRFVPGGREAARLLAGAARDALTRPVFALDGHPYAVLDVLALPALLGAVWLAVGLVVNALRGRLLRTSTDPGPRDLALGLVRYLVALVAGVVVLQAWGIDVHSLAMVASVLGVGIGFGLQHIANNFVSGLLIGAERPIRPGDYVTLGELSGTVERIGARSTEILTNDRVKILVPNARFLEQEVVNWTHGDPVCRLHVPVNVAYGSDVEEVRAALLEAAAGHPHVLVDPAPRVEFRSFDDSALAFELLVWTRSPRTQAAIASDLNFRVLLCLARHGLSVPFPQRDLNLPPRVEEILVAWAERTLGLESLREDGARRTRERAREAARSLDAFDARLGPRTWSDDELAEVVARMRGLRGEAGVDVRDRRHLLTVHPRCFVGREAVDWLVRTLRLPRDEAVALGRLLVTHGAVHHVLDEHGFRDGNFFYRFRDDEPAALADGGAPLTTPRCSASMPTARAVPAPRRAAAARSRSDRASG